MKNSNLRKNRANPKALTLSLIIGSILLSAQSISQAESCYIDQTDQVIIPTEEFNEYRRADGKKNNPDHNSWGAEGQKLIRVVGTDKSRYPNTPNLANPREISNKVSQQDTNQNTRNVKGLSDLFWLWGQFLDHDITIIHTDERKPANIPVSAIDPNFSADIPFNRSQKKYRNNLTSYIDGSNIYSASRKTERRLRTRQDGKLILNNGYLPQDDDGFYIAGDERVNEHIGLTAMHTLWAREHNRIVDAIACQHPDWRDDELFNEAKRIVIAELQAITFNEFLPQLIGKNTLPSYGGLNPGYDTNVNANISHIFAASAFRFGHSMLSPVLLRLDKDGKEVYEKHVPLREAFFRPDKLEEAGIDPIFRGFASQVAQALDPMVVDDVRNFLLQSPGDKQGFDLVALNIQRGRDHGLPSYNDIRQSLNLPPITSFEASTWHEDFKTRLANAYADTNNIDPWIGGLAEKKEGDALTGKLLQTLLAEQFRRIRNGDRFWYENQFNEAQIALLNATTLSDIIKRNTSIKKGEIQSNVFIASEIHDPVEVNTPPSASPTIRFAPAAADPADATRENHIKEAIHKGDLG